MGDQSNCIAFVTHIKMDMVPVPLFHEVMSRRRCGRFAKPSGIDPGQTTPRNGSTTWKGHFLHPVTQGERKLVMALIQSV